MNTKLRRPFLAELTRRIGWRKEENPKAASRRLLLVQSDNWLRGFLTQELAREGYQVDNAPDGRAALELLGVNEYDLMILDIVMPRMDGLEVLREMKMTFPKPVTIMLSGCADLNAVNLCIKEGAADFLGLPCDYDEILETVQRHLKRLPWLADPHNPHASTRQHV
jgi:DNA-binding response OmpR family regulator